jgi:hypothetical protein
MQAETLLEVRGLAHAENSSPAANCLSTARGRSSPTSTPARTISPRLRVYANSLAVRRWRSNLPPPGCADSPFQTSCREIERNLDILATAQQDLPPRHRSIRAVFDHFWNLLSPEERIVFQKQAVFRGGFTREAFEAITGANLSMLARFVDKSAVHFSEDGRYRRHSLMVQYGTLRLSENDALCAQVRETHALYFSKFVNQLEKEFIGGQPQKPCPSF